MGLGFSNRSFVTSAAGLLVALMLVVSEARADATSPWHGDYFPNVTLTDQDGTVVRFYDDMIKNKIVTINFIYTDCKDICPADTAQMLRVQELLGDRVGRDVFMYSISIDPEHDTPEVLKKYMYTFGVKPGWRFLTGKKEDILLIQQKLAMRVVEPGKPKNHDTSVMVGNEKSAHWIKRSIYDDPVILANLLTDTLTNYKINVAGTREGYSAAPQIKSKSRGDFLFKTRCTSCHTIGGGDRLGPDLQGVVAARPRAWLSRWLKEPDKMIDEGDPVATELKARYRNLPMPNFAFGDLEADAVIEYLTEQDAILAAKRKAQEHQH